MYSIVNSLLTDVNFLFQPEHYRPYIVYGHSFGAVLAFEFVRAIRKNCFRAPQALICSGVTAPHIPYPASPISELPLPDFRNAMYNRYGSVLTVDNKLSKILIPPVRADMYAVEHYKFKYIPFPPSPIDHVLIKETGSSPLAPQPPEVPTPSVACKLIVVTGSEDTIFHPSMMEDWRCHTSGEFETHVMQGCGHFYYEDTRMIDILQKEVNRAVLVSFDHVVFTPKQAPVESTKPSIWKSIFTPTNILAVLLFIAVLVLILLQLWRNHSPYTILPVREHHFERILYLFFNHSFVIVSFTYFQYRVLWVVFWICFPSSEILSWNGIVILLFYAILLIF